MTINETIKTIATALGLEKAMDGWLGGWYYSLHDHPGDIRIPDGSDDSPVYPVDLICFAAFARAEMAKRGIGTELCSSRVAKAHIGMGPMADRHWGHLAAEFDPTDPISEATAFLRCCAVALSPNAKDQGRA